MLSVHEKVEAVIEDAGSNLREAAEKIGIKYSTFHSSIRGKRKVDFEVIDLISKAYSVDLRYFSEQSEVLSLEASKTSDPLTQKIADVLDKALRERHRQSRYEGSQVTLEDFLNWWFQNNGRLESFDRLAPFVDLFTPPSRESKQILPHKTGLQSLASVCFDVTCPDQLRQTLDGFNPDVNTSLVQAHISALEQGEPVITHPSLDVRLRDGSRFTRRYRRVLAQVLLPNGKPLIANFSQDIQDRLPRLEETPPSSTST